MKQTNSQTMINSISVKTRISPIISSVASPVAATMSKNQIKDSAQDQLLDKQSNVVPDKDNIADQSTTLPNTTTSTSIKPKAPLSSKKKKVTKPKPDRIIASYLLGSSKNDADLYGIPTNIINLMNNQPCMNIITIGDVSHGKSTLMWALCNEKTGKDSREIKRNMTIKLGYTSCKVFKCLLCYNNCKNDKFMAYFSENSNKMTDSVKCPNCKTSNLKYWKSYKLGNRKDGIGKDNVIGPILLIRHISFVDCPGHSVLMGTMISAACVADGALMVTDASQPFPGKQTVQHASAAHLLGILTNAMNEEKTDDNDNRVKLIVAQNKIDLISPKQACLNVDEIRRFLAKYDKELSINVPIIPISAQSRFNIDALCHTIVKKLPKYSPRLCMPSSLGNDLQITMSNNNNNEYGNNLHINIIRSFDVNKPCVFANIKDIEKLQGGVLGGVIINGTIKIGDKLCIRPGLVIPLFKDNIFETKMKKLDLNDKLSKKLRIEELLKPRFKCIPIETHVIGLKCGTKKLEMAYPGANVGVQLNIDPSLTQKDRMSGYVINSSNDKKMAPIFNVFIIGYVLLSPFNKSNKYNFQLFEQIKINIGAFKVNGIVVNKKVNLESTSNMKAIKVVLDTAVSARVASGVAITRKIKGEWKLAAGGIIYKVRQIPSSQN